MGRRDLNPRRDADLRGPWNPVPEIEFDAVRDTRQRLWLRLTDTGRSAYQGHVAALRRISEGS